MLNYPNTPTNGQVFNTWKYDGVKWGPNTAIIGVPDAPSNGITFGRNNGLWQDITATTGPLYVAKSGDTMGGDLGVPSVWAVDTVEGNWLHSRGDIQSDTRIHSMSGRIMSESNSMPTLGLWSYENGWAAGFLMGGAGDAQLYIAGLNGDGSYANVTYARWDSNGNYWVNGAITAGGNLNVSGDSNLQNTYVRGGLGIQYTSASGNWYRFGWNGRVQAWIDGGGAYVEMLDTRDYVPNQNVNNGANPTFGTVQCNGDCNANGWLRGAWVATRAREETPWGFSGYGGNGWYAVNGWGGSYGPLGWNGRRAYSNEAPVSIDCLDVVRKIELSRFKYDDVNEDVAVGFHAERIREILPALTHDKPQQWDDTWEFGYPVNTNAVLALLLGAIQQLDARMGVQ